MISKKLTTIVLAGLISGSFSQTQCLISFKNAKFFFSRFVTVFGIGFGSTLIHKLCKEKLQTTNQKTKNNEPDTKTIIDNNFRDGVIEKTNIISSI